MPFAGIRFPKNSVFQHLEMDPLSISASVAGLVAVAANICSTLATISSQKREAPRLIESVRLAVIDVRAAVRSLENLLSDLVHAQTRRLDLIQLEQLVVVLTEAVLTFSELETIITPFATSQIWDRLEWVQKESTVSRIFERLQRHTSAFSLILKIVNW